MNRSPALQISLMTAGYILWSLSLVVIYAMQSLGCELGWNAVRIGFWQLDLNRTVLIGLWVVSLGLLGALVYWLWWRFGQASTGGEEPYAFATLVALVGAVVGLAATLWVAFPILFLTQCL